MEVSIRVRRTLSVLTISTKLLLALKKQVNGFMLFSREKKDELTSQASLIPGISGLSVQGQKRISNSIKESKLVNRVRRARVPLVCHALKFARIFYNKVCHASSSPRFFQTSVSLVCHATSLPRL